MDSLSWDEQSGIEVLDGGPHWRCSQRSPLYRNQVMTTPFTTSKTFSHLSDAWAPSSPRGASLTDNVFRAPHAFQLACNSSPKNVCVASHVSLLRGLLRVKTVQIFMFSRKDVKKSHFDVNPPHQSRGKHRRWINVDSTLSRRGFGVEK